MLHLLASQRLAPQVPPAAIAEVLRIRLAGARDRGAVRRIECACFGRGRLLFGLWPRVGSLRATTWLAEADRRPAGYLIAYENVLDGKPAMRLMKAALAAYGAVWLHVRAGNVPAIALYRSLGMQQARRLAGFYANGDDALVMATPDLMNRAA
jgi:hypothetical protein